MVNRKVEVMIYNLNIENKVSAFVEQSNWFVDNKKIVELKEIKDTRSNAQNRARWVYLEMVSSILNERGHTFCPPGFNMEVPFTKDNLYEIYWHTLRKYMFPNKTKQLNTKEFSDLVDMVLMMFAKVFGISIAFPNWEDYTRKEPKQ